MTNATISPVRTLDDLVTRLHEELACKGIDQMDETAVTRIRALMASMASRREEWGKFAHFDPNKYTRNLVDDGNGRFNLMVLCWPEGRASAIHDHSGSHCLMKVLDGQILETQFEWPSTAGVPMKVRRTTTYELEEVAYINDSLGLHRISNNSNTSPAVTLHLYCPPYDCCKTFSEETSEQRASGKCCFHSRKGELLKQEI